MCLIESIIFFLLLFIRLQHQGVFELIKKHNLGEVIYENIVQLIQLNSERAIAMLLECKNFASDDVVDKLNEHEEYLYMVSCQQHSCKTE